MRGERLSAVGGTMAELAEICQRWGAAIATLHLTRIAAGERAAGGTPTVGAGPGSAAPGDAPGTRRQRPRVRAAHPCASIVDCSGRSSGSPIGGPHDHWTHGDLTEDRVRVQRSPDLRVRFVDLRGGGLGDPGWDLSGALETVSELTAGPRAPWGSASAACLTDFLLQGYRRAGGSASVDAGTRALRIVARAWEQAAVLDARTAHAASMHPAAGRPTEATRLTERLALARELAARSARAGLAAA